MRRLILIATFFLITHDAGTVFAQNSPQLSSDVAARVDRVFKKWDKPDSPGCALGVYKDGQIVYKRGYGWQT
jgi:CubicO group peptidase (beta-lactamase class C family)